MMNLKLNREGSNWVCNINLAAGDGRLIGIGNTTNKLNEGTRATVLGMVTYISSDGSYICLDDGSNQSDNYGNRGIGVSLGKSDTLSVGEFVSVTGIVKFEGCGRKRIVTLEPTKAKDIVRN
jgi:hypothetical protein